MPEQDTLLIAQRAAGDVGIKPSQYGDLPSKVRTKALQIAEALLEARRQQDEGQVQELEGDLANLFERSIDTFADKGINI